MNQHSGSAKPMAKSPARPLDKIAATAPPTARGKRTREKLLRAAEHVFGRNSFHNTSIADIARKAGVALGSFYVYFPDKQSIFIELVDELGDRLRRELAAAVGELDNRIDVEVAGLRAFFAFAEEHRQLYRIVRECEFVDEPTFLRYYQRMAKGYSRGLQAAADGGQVHAPHVETLAYALMGMADFLGMRFVLWSENKKGRAQVIAAAAEFLREGLAPRKPAAKLVSIRGRK